MAQAISNKVLIDDQRYCWLICDYSVSGSTMTYTLSFHFDLGCAQLTNPWIKVGGTTVWSQSGTVHAYNAAHNPVSHTPVIKSNGTATINGTQTVTFGITKYNGVSLQGSFNVSGGATPTDPTGLYVSNVSSTWNTVKGTVGLSSYGTGVGPKTLEFIVLTEPYVAGLAHRYTENTSGAMSMTSTVTNSSNCSGVGCITIKGASQYYTGCYVNNGSRQGRAQGASVYTPPAPLQSITYTQTQNASNVGISATITGGNSTNNSSNTVTTYYRYSTNGGSTYTSWTSAGTGTAWTAKTATFNVPYNSNIVIQAKQTYQSKDSDVKQITFTSTSGTAPSAGSVSITGSTWNTVTLAASGVNYGKPSSISGRKMAIGVRVGPTDATYKRENQVENATSATTTVTNSSIYPAGQPLQLKGMLPVYAYLWVWNTVTSSTVDYKTSPYYLPPAPGTGNYTKQSTGHYTINYSGVAANNVTDYTASELKRTVRYKIDNGAWTYVDNNVQKALTTVTSEQITVPYQSTATVEAWLTYRGKESAHTTFTITEDVRPVHFYGSVYNEAEEVHEAEEIEHFYGSVNGQTVKIRKLYASVGGVAKEIFEDV